VRTASGDFKWISWNATYIASEDSVYLISQDHTTTHLAEKKLKEEKSIGKKHLEASLKAQKKEREQIGRELHDNINQMLATAMLYHSSSRGEGCSVSVVLPLR
jgi:signal transduction histidine kinase